MDLFIYIFCKNAKKEFNFMGTKVFSEAYAF